MEPPLPYTGSMFAIIDLPPANEVLAAMITPAVLISASGTLTMSTSNRLGRVVERVRVLNNDAENLCTGPLDGDKAERMNRIAEQIDSLNLRIHLLRSALSVLYMAVGLLVGTSLTIGVTAAAKSWLGWVPVMFALAGGTTLLRASYLLWRETRVAVNSSIREMEHVRATVAKKTGLFVPPPADGVE